MLVSMEAPASEERIFESMRFDAFICLFVYFFFHDYIRDSRNFLDFESGERFDDLYIRIYIFST